MAGPRLILPIDEKRRGRFRRRSPEPRLPAPSSADAGRAWINGREVGGTDPRYAHLSRSYD